METPRQPDRADDSPWEISDAALDTIRIKDCGEPLVELHVACPRLVLGAEPRWARRAVAERLNEAQRLLDTLAPGYRLRVGDAWRSLEHQARLFRLAYRVAWLLHPFWPPERVRELANIYVAAPDAPTPAPHTTGGAVDVGLMTPQGRRAFMGPRALAATQSAYPRLSEPARRHRQLLRTVMEQAGFINYPAEWWHWSYGDSLWALHTGQPHAFYGLAEPPMIRDSAPE